MLGIKLGQPRTLVEAELLLQPNVTAMAEELSQQAARNIQITRVFIVMMCSPCQCVLEELPLCSDGGAFSMPSDQTEAESEGGRAHVARGAWRVAGPGVVQFMRRLCLVTVLMLLAVGLPIAVVSFIVADFRLQ